MCDSTSLQEQESGGLCGHCSRDRPLDKRLLFVAELTGQNRLGCVGNAPTPVRLDIRFTGGSRSLRGYQPKVSDVKWWTATALHRARPLARRVTY